MPAPSPMQVSDDGKDSKLEIGTPIIIGGLGGIGGIPNGIGAASFAISYSFGELSPINKNPIVKIIVPITLQTSIRYQITLSMTKPPIADANAVQYSDIGVGLQNLRLLGSGSCAGAIQAPFNNDPATAMTISPATGRATYPSSLANVGSNTIVIRGPAVPNGAAFDLIFAAAPQFYTPGGFTFTLIVNLQVGSSFSC